MQILIILPVHNEEESLPELTKRILETNHEYKILIIDDNSTDNSTAVSLELLENNPERIFFIRRDKQKGRGAAVIEGYKFAVSKGFDCVVEMDADLSHSPAYAPLLIREIENADIVIGSRYIKNGGVKGRSSYRNIISCLASVYLRFLLGLEKIKDVTSGYRCMNIEFLKALDFNSLESEGPELLEEILFKNKHRARIKEIPIIFEERRFGKTKFSLSIALRCLLAPLKWRLLTILK